MNVLIAFEPGSGMVCVHNASCDERMIRRKVLGKDVWEKVAVVSSLHIYPIKSCKGISVDEMELDR